MSEFDNSQEHPVPMGYILGLSREYPYVKTAHLYKGTFANPGNPMCRRGWNRDGGQSYSIWRGWVGTSLTVCKICWRRALAGKDGVETRPAPTEKQK